MADNVLNALKQFVSNDLLQNSSMKIDETVPLIEDGYLTSLQTVELVMFIEERFQVEIDPELVNEENFRTLGTVAALVESKLGAA